MNETRAPMVAALVEAGAPCEIGQILRAAGVPGAERCAGKVEGLHERRKRSAGGSLANPENLIPACNFCNGLVEDQPALVRERTGDLLVVREGDEEWDSLGARQDR